jgi:hypothetical protein
VPELRSKEPKRKRVANSAIRIARNHMAVILTSMAEQRMRKGRIAPPENAPLPKL